MVFFPHLHAKLSPCLILLTLSIILFNILIVFFQHSPHSSNYHSTPTFSISFALTLSVFLTPSYTTQISIVCFFPTLICNIFPHSSTLMLSRVFILFVKRFLPLDINCVMKGSFLFLSDLIGVDVFLMLLNSIEEENKHLKAF